MAVSLLVTEPGRLQMEAGRLEFSVASARRIGLPVRPIPVSWLERSHRLADALPKNAGRQ
jgi:hypothetical protein